MLAFHVHRYAGTLSFVWHSICATRWMNCVRSISCLPIWSHVTEFVQDRTPMQRQICHYGFMEFASQQKWTKESIIQCSPRLTKQHCLLFVAYSWVPPCWSMNNLTRFHCGIEEDPPQGGTEGGTYEGTYGETRELDKRNLCVLRAGRWWTSHIYGRLLLFFLCKNSDRDVHLKKVKI